MKLKILACASTLDHPGFKQLIRSMDKFGYDYKIIQDPNIGWAWGGIPHIIDWCNNESDGYTHVLCTDAFDTLFLGPQEEIKRHYTDMDALLLSGEKGCFPIAELAGIHPPSKDYQLWKYVNAGGFMMPVKALVDFFANRDTSLLSQEWIMRQYLTGQSNIKIDLECQIFQTIAFEIPGDFSYQGERLVNDRTGTKPILIHGNGHTDMQHIYELLK